MTGMAGVALLTVEVEVEVEVIGAGGVVARETFVRAVTIEGAAVTTAVTPEAAKFINEVVIAAAAILPVRGSHRRLRHHRRRR